MSSIINIVSAVIVALLVIGFFVGFFRGWAKSLTRFICLLVSFVVALFVAPVIAETIVSKFASGTQLSIAGFSVDFKEVVNSLVNDSALVDTLLGPDSTTTHLATALMNVVINLVLFLLIFLAISILSWIIYSIVTLVMGVKKKKNGNVVEKTKSYWWLKVLGGGIGFVSSIVMIMALLNPVFGVMNICDKFVGEPKTSTAQTASAYSPSNLICGELYYKNEEPTLVDEYTEKYLEFRSLFNKSVGGFVLKYTGTQALGGMAFNHLTSVKQGSLDVSFVDEFVAIAETYNLYKTNFSGQKFDITDNDDIDAVLKIYGTAKKSELVKNYLIEFSPEIYTKWNNNEKFLGIPCPVNNEYKNIFLLTLSVMNTSNFKQIDQNLESILKIIKIANNNDIIEKMQKGEDLVDAITESQGFLRDTIVQLSTSVSMRRTIPKVLNETIDILYDQLVNDGKELEFSNLTNAQIDTLNWKNEGTVLENAIVKILKVSKNLEGKDSSALIDELKNIGSALDDARQSKLIAKPLKGFMLGFIDKKVNLEETVKTTLTNNISKYWDINESEENRKFKFEQMFEAIETAAKVADNIGKTGEDVSITDLEDTLKVIIENESIKEAMTEAITNNIIGEVVDDQQDAEILTDMLNTFVNNIEDPDDVASELQAGQTIVDLMNNAKENNNNIVLNEQNKEAEAEQIVTTLVNSNAVMAMIKENNESSALKDLTASLGGDVNLIKNQINAINADGNDELAANKAALQKLFGIEGA